MAQTNLTIPIKYAVFSYFWGTVPYCITSLFLLKFTCCNRIESGSGSDTLVPTYTCKITGVTMLPTLGQWQLRGPATSCRALLEQLCNPRSGMIMLVGTSKSFGILIEVSRYLGTRVGTYGTDRFHLFWYFWKRHPLLAEKCTAKNNFKFWNC